MNWIICFKKANNIGTWRLFTAHRPDFGHVFAVRYDPELDLWIRFEVPAKDLILSFFQRVPQIIWSMTWLKTVSV